MPEDGEDDESDDVFVLGPNGDSIMMMFTFN